MSVLRTESSHGGRTVHALAKVHSQSLSTVYEEWVDDSPRSVPAQQSLLFLQTETDSEVVQPTQDP